MRFILGKKLAMTQRYQPDGRAVAATKVLAEPCVVTQVKQAARDGYTAVQIAGGKKRKMGKAIAGHLKGKGPFAVLREFRLTPDEAGKISVGDRITVATFQAGDVVKVTGTSKGRGFQGVVKRHHFSGQPKTHGHKDQLRMPGSSGAGGVQRVRPGKRMPGRMGNAKVTVKNLEILAVDAAENVLYVKGAVPGSPNSQLLIQGPGELNVEKAEPPVVKTEMNVSNAVGDASETPTSSNDKVQMPNQAQDPKAQ